MKGKHLSDRVYDVLLENGPTEGEKLAKLANAGYPPLEDIRHTVRNDDRFVFDDSGRVHLTTENGDT